MLSTLKKLISRNDKSSLCNVDCALEELRQGRMIIVTDSEDRENEGDIVIPAQDITPDIVNFMASEAKGLICVPVTKDRSEKLNLSPMVSENEEEHRTAFTVSVDARNGVTTGISAFDRFETIRLLSSDQSKATDFVRPGHIFPLVAREGGVLVRAGHTEASIDLCELAGKKPVAVICEIMKPDGSMARMDDLKEFSQKHKIRIVTIQALIEYRRKREHHIQLAAEKELFRDGIRYVLKVFTTEYDQRVHIALVKGDFNETDKVPVRVQSHSLLESLTSYIDHVPDPLGKSFDYLNDRDFGIILLIGEEKDDILHLFNQETPSEDEVLRNIGIGAQILKDLGVKKIELLTQSQKKLVGLEGYGLEITEQISL